MSDTKTGAVHLDSASFDTTLAEAGDMPVLVDFYADWCGPCKMAAPIIEEMAEEYEGKAIIAKVDVDANNELAGKFGVMSIPTVIVFKNGKEVKRQSGFAGKQGFIALLDAAMV
jgi:thioredoxin 1